MENINVIEILIYIINFVVTFVLLYLLLYKPVSKFLAGRRERIVASLKEAEATQSEAQRVFEEAKAELAGTAEKSRQLSHEAFENAARDAQRVLDDAEDDAATIVERAREQMQAERQAALERAYTELLSLAKDVSSRILSREVSIEDNRRIVEDFFSEVTRKRASDEAASGTVAQEESNP